MEHWSEVLMADELFHFFQTPVHLCLSKLKQTPLFIYGLERI